MIKKMLPYDYYLGAVVKSTSKALKDLKQDPLKEEDFLCYIGMWLLMSACSGWSRKDFWLSKPFDEKIQACPYNLLAYVLRN